MTTDYSNLQPHIDAAAYIRAHTVRECHNRAMELAQDGYVLNHRNRPDEAQPFFETAYLYERGAAEKLDVSPDTEPSRAILYRSAANLALSAGWVNSAIKMAAEGLQGYPPADIYAELIDVLRRATDPNLDEEPLCVVELHRAVVGSDDEIITRREHAADPAASASGAQGRE